MIGLYLSAFHAMDLSSSLPATAVRSKWRHTQIDVIHCRFQVGTGPRRYWKAQRHSSVGRGFMGITLLHWKSSRPTKGDVVVTYDALPRRVDRDTSNLHRRQDHGFIRPSRLSFWRYKNTNGSLTKLKIRPVWHPRAVSLMHSSTNDLLSIIGSSIYLILFSLQAALSAA